MKLAVCLILGAAAAGAIVYFLSTEEGKAFADKVKKDATDLGGNIGGAVDELIKKGKSIIGNAEEQVA